MKPLVVPTKSFALLLAKQAMFTFLCERWQDLFQADFDVLLYDLTSTYFECDPPDEGKRKFGYSRRRKSWLETSKKSRERSPM